MFFCVIVFKMGFSVVFKSWMVDNLSEFSTNVWHHFVFVINPVFPLLKMKWLVWLTQHNCICKQCFSNYDKISVFPLGVFQLWRQDFLQRSSNYQWHYFNDKCCITTRDHSCNTSLRANFLCSCTKLLAQPQINAA